MSTETNGDQGENKDIHIIIIVVVIVAAFLIVFFVVVVAVVVCRKHRRYITLWSCFISLFRIYM